MYIYFTFELREDLKQSLLADFSNVEFYFSATVEEGALKNADIVVTYGEDLTEEHIAIADRLQWIFVVSAGIEKMPNKAIADKGIVVSNVRGIHKYPMAESILAHILAQKRGLPWIYSLQTKKQWNRQSQFSELRDSTAIILGAGAIGSEIGRLLQAFGVKTIGCNHSGKSVHYMHEVVSFTELLTVLPEADIVLSLLPHTDETTHLLTRKHFELMKDTAIFMNFGRGNLVALDVLVDVLQERLIHHAVLDVYEEEPLPAEHPLWQLDNVTISPHVSSHSSRYLERSLEIFKPSLEKWLDGERDLENVMDVLRGY